MLGRRLQLVEEAVVVGHLGSLRIEVVVQVEEAIMVEEVVEGRRLVEEASSVVA